jgi:hypothetical protein
MEKFYNINSIEIGLDEAGRGPLIGNVYAGAVVWENDLKPPDGLIVDSKKLSSKKYTCQTRWQTLIAISPSPRRTLGRRVRDRKNTHRRKESTGYR